MTRYSSSYTTTTTVTAATYNTFHGKFSAGLQAASLTKTSDNGQVVFGTTPATATLGMVYEVYAFSDALQATKPVFIRVDYVGSTAYEVYLTVGTGTDGNGTITGQWLTQWPLGSNGPTGNAQTSGLVRYLYTSGDGSYVTLLSNLSGSTGAATAVDNMGAVVIERTRDIDGTANGNGVNIYRWRAFFDNYQPTGTNLSTWQGSVSRSHDTTLTAYGPEVEFNALLPNKSQVTSYVYNGTAMAYPVYGYLADGRVQGASKALMLGFVTDWPQMKTSVNVSHYGATMQFLTPGAYSPLSTSYAIPPTGWSSAITYGGRGFVLCPLFRWE